ncbi:MAG: flippase-like domain-containing protein [Coriobacteriales bacterium]|nr:flippase-like domain-containing protein [Coriobacteriales bacterium]
MNTRRLVTALVVAGMLSVLVYGVLFALTDIQAVLSDLKSFPVEVFGVMLVLSLVCFALRAIRWKYLTHLTGRPLSVPDAFYVQFSGMTMTITPGKVGELLKPFLMKQLVGMPMSRGIAMVFSERVADLIAVLLLSAGGLTLLGEGGIIAYAIGLGIVAIGTLAVSSKRFHDFALRMVERTPWIKQHHASASAISETIQAALTPVPLIISVLFSAMAWGAEGVGFWLARRALGFEGLAVLPAVAIYAVSTIIGAIAFIPGGVGLTEASLAGLAVASGATGSVATTATLLTRIATLWFGLAVGWVVIAFRPRLVRTFLTGQSDSDGSPAEATS